MPCDMDWVQGEIAYSPIKEENVNFPLPCGNRDDSNLVENASNNMSRFQQSRWQGAEGTGMWLHHIAVRHSNKRYHGSVPIQALL
jgi:hypothetical protein